MRVLGLLLILLVAVPTVLAQVPPAVPSSPFAAGVSVETAASVAVASDGPAKLTVTVRNTATPTNTPLDQQRQVVLEATGAPDGWSATLPAGPYKLGPGQSQAVQLTLSVSPSSSAKEARITVTARMLPLGADAVPVLGPVVDPEASASATVQATRQDEPLRAFVEAVGPAAVVGGLALLAILVVVLVVVALRRRSPLRIEAEPTSLAVRPGASGSLTLTVRNAGRRAERVLLDGAAARGWEVEVPEHVLELEPGAAHVVEVVVAAGKRASASELIVVAVAQREGAPTARLVVPLTLQSAPAASGAVKGE